MDNKFIDFLNNIIPITEKTRITSKEKLYYLWFEVLFMSIILIVILIINVSGFLYFIFIDYEVLEATVNSVQERTRYSDKVVTYYLVYNNEDVLCSWTKPDLTIFPITIAGTKQKIAVPIGEPHYGKPYSLKYIYIIRILTIIFLLFYVYLYYKVRIEDYEDFKIEQKEQEKTDRLNKRKYKLGNQNIILPNEIKTVVRLKYGVAILTKLPRNSNSPRNVYNFLDDGRLLWQIDPSIDIFGITELSNIMGLEYQFEDLILQNNTLYVKAKNVSFNIDIGTGKCISHNILPYEQTRNHTKVKEIPKKNDFYKKLHRFLEESEKQEQELKDRRASKGYKRYLEWLIELLIVAIFSILFMLFNK